MSSIKRSGTLNTLKRSNTMQTIKRAGTGAWRWINADDVNVNQNHPVGVSYFQRSNTYKRLNGGGTIGGRAGSRKFQQRPTYGQNQAQTYGAGSSNYPYNNNSYAVNMNDMSNTSGYGSSIKRPEPAAEKFEKENDMNRRKKNSKIPSVLYDPEVRKQLEQMKQHKPYFMYFVTIFQIAVFLFELYNNFVALKSPVVGMDQNPMLGPSSGVLISMGARFLPCMKETQIPRMYCPVGIKNTFALDENKVCDMYEICAFGMKKGDTPNQWYRFITPIFIHCGVLHIIFNLSFQIRTGIQMEKDFGTLRIAIIYMASGIFGFAFEANSALLSPSVGCSGSLYGLMACLLLDLIQSWRLIIEPWKELVKMLLIIAFSLGIGLLPFVDNYAHIGGFIMGILTGLVFLPSIIFSKRDLRIKRILMIVSVFLSIGLFIWVFRQFYYSINQCTWCHYLNCLPIGHWCDALNSQAAATTTNATYYNQ